MIGAEIADSAATSIRRLTIQRAALIGLLVFLACTAGILTRLPGTLAAFWPANALLLGVLVRFPRAATMTTWISSAIGYVAADFITGGALVPTLVLNFANIAGVAAGFYAFRWIDNEDRTPNRVRSVAYLVAMSLVGALSAGVVGGIADIVLFGGRWSNGFILWFPTELVHYMTIVPLVLTCPPFWHRLRPRNARGTEGMNNRWLRRLFLPMSLLVLCMSLAWAIRGPGALAFPMPALVLAALVTDVFVTALFIASSTASALLLAAEGDLGMPANVPVPVNASVQIGLALLAVGPIAVACVITERGRLLDALRYAGTHDDLTGTLRRDEFFRLAEATVSSLGRHARPAALLMLDLDHFKKVNDHHGHRTGDNVLVDFAGRVQNNLRKDDLFGRIGGEEFAVLLPDIDLDSAHEVAERLRNSQQQSATTHGATVSTGLAYAPAGHVSLTKLLDTADAALYRAKASRNTIITAMVNTH